MCESSLNKSTSEVIPTSSPGSFDGYAERMILCEAALQTVEKLDPGSDEASKILYQMETTYHVLETSLESPRPSVVLESPSLESDVDETTTPKLTESAIEIGKQITVENSESITINDKEKFAQALINSSTTLQHGDEGSSDELGSLIMKALTSPPLSKLEVQATLNKIGDAVYGLNRSAVSSENLTTDTLFNRAIMGEAALQAILQVPPTKLQALQLNDNKVATAGMLQVLEFARKAGLDQLRKL